MRGADPSLSPADSAERIVQRFTVPGVSNYTALLLSPDGGTLYLGAREVLFAVNTSHFQPGAPARRVSPCRAPQDHRAPGRAGGTEPKFGAGSVQDLVLFAASWDTEEAAAPAVLAAGAQPQAAPAPCGMEPREDSGAGAELCQPQEGCQGDSR